MDGERTPCAACGRETPTTGRGACVECWAPKRPGGTSPFTNRRALRERLDLFDWLDALDDVPRGWWAGGVLTLAGIVLLVALRG